MTLAAPPPFRVELPGYAGDLAGLASALRSGMVTPGEVPLLPLTRALLAWVEAQAVPSDQQAELLPALAGVIAMKARLLLPRAETDPVFGDQDGELDDGLEGEGNLTAAGVEALAELELLVRLLSQRRREREGLIPAQALTLDLPRRERPHAGRAGLERLVRAARSAVREVQVPLLARERLTLAAALGALRAFGGRLGHFRLSAVVAADWGERGTYFAALLEGVKSGDFEAEQEEQYGEIMVRRATPDTPQASPTASTTGSPASGPSSSSAPVSPP